MKAQQKTERDKKIRMGLRVLFPLLAGLWVVFIFSNSLAAGGESAGLSLTFTRFFNNGLASLGIPGEISHHFVRKAAHFTEYALLGIPLFLGLSAFVRPAPGNLAWPLLAGLCAAVADETIQTFVPGRVGTPVDVLIDFFGLCAGVFIGFLLLLALRRARRRRPAPEKASG